MALGKEGKSLTYIATVIGVTRQTLHNWRKDFPEFEAACLMALQHAQVWWEDTGQSNLATMGFSASMWSRSMAARFPDEWREVKGTELTGANGGPVQTVARIERHIVDPAD